MSPRAMVETALMLGAIVIAAGAYGLTYCLARLYGNPLYRAAIHASRVALCVLAVAIVALTPLHPGWKVLVVASTAAYLLIPPITWRYLSRLHRGESHAAGPAQHAHRAATRLYRRA